MGTSAKRSSTMMKLTTYALGLLLFATLAAANDEIVPETAQSAEVLQLRQEIAPLRTQLQAQLQAHDQKFQAHDQKLQAHDQKLLQTKRFDSCDDVYRCPGIIAREGKGETSHQPLGEKFKNTYISSMGPYHGGYHGGARI